MGLLGFSKKKETSISPSENKRDISISLTPVGKQKAEQFALEGPKFDILATLLEDGVQSVGEIASKTGHSVNKVREICKSLVTNGYIKILKIKL